MKEEIAKIISHSSKVLYEDAIHLIEVPTNSSFGDYSFPCFVLAKKLNNNPVEVAKELSEELNKTEYKGIYLIEHKGAYLNFFIDRRIFAANLLKEFEKNKFGYVKQDNKKVVIEFSQPNTHKAFHVGHIRGTSIGESLSRILEYHGNKVIRVNYSGDTGMHVAKWIWGYTKFHNKEKLKDDEKWIAGIYVDAVKRLEENKEYESEVELVNQKIVSREDKKLNDIWKKSRSHSIKSWKPIYKDLNTRFDKHYFESQVEEDGRIIAEGLLDKEIASRDDAIFINLDEYELGVWVLVRKDGTVLYSAKDIALAYKKTRELPADEYFVLVADEQKRHFEQLLKTLELMKFLKKEHYKSLTFGLVKLPHGKMSSRTGDNVLYSDFINELSEHARKGFEKRGEKKNLKERARTIAISAIKYSMLKQDQNKQIVFDPKSAISFEGDTGPYLLYSYARANSIIKKIKGFKKIKVKDLKVNFISDIENNLIKKIYIFPDIVTRAYQQKTPNLIANYAYELSQLFNEFYHQVAVIGSPEEKFRAKLVEAFMKTLKKCCDLLGIDVLEKM